MFIEYCKSFLIVCSVLAILGLAYFGGYMDGLTIGIETTLDWVYPVEDVRPGPSLHKM